MVLACVCVYVCVCARVHGEKRKSDRIHSLWGRVFGLCFRFLSYKELHTAINMNMIGKIYRLNKICEWCRVLCTHHTLAVSIPRRHILEFVLSLLFLSSLILLLCVLFFSSFFLQKSDFEQPNWRCVSRVTLFRSKGKGCPRCWQRDYLTRNPCQCQRDTWDDITLGRNKDISQFSLTSFKVGNAFT